MLSAIEQTRLRISKNTDAKWKSHLGQFFTPVSTAQFMAGLFPEISGGVCRLLDAGAGVGSLSSAFLEKIISGELAFDKTDVSAFEFDDRLHGEIKVGVHGKMPDVIIYYREKNWLILVEAVVSSGPVDGDRHAELAALFKDSRSGLVFVSAFPDRCEVFRKFLAVVAWETEVWCASDPTHLIHFNGTRFLGPYSAI